MLLTVLLYVWIGTHAAPKKLPTVVGSTLAETYHLEGCRFVNADGEHYVEWGDGEYGINEARRHAKKPCPDCFLSP